MNGTDKPVNISKLTSFLETTLEATNQTKACITKSGIETRNALKNWLIPEKQEIASELPQCTCFTLNNDTNLKDIAQGIGDVVGNAQKLRETLISNKTKMRNGLQVTVNAPPSAASKSRSILGQSERGKIPVIQKMQARTMTSKTNLGRLDLIDIKNNETVETNNNSTNTISRSTSASSLQRKKSATSAQSTYQKDFATRSESRLSNTSSKVMMSGRNVRTPSSKTDNSKETFNSKTVNSQTGPITMAQLEKLLDRVSIDATLYPHPIRPTIDSVPDSQPYNVNCLVHGQNVPLNLGLVQAPLEQSVELAEAIDVIGVPSDLVKILRPYHRFVAKYQDRDKQKESKAANKFLALLTDMNKSEWSEAMSEPSASLFADYMPLYKSASEMSASAEICPRSLSELRNTFDGLENSYRKCANCDASSSPSVTVSPRNIPLPIESAQVSEWTISGIWNDTSIGRFKDYEDALFIRYSNVPQLKNFHSNIQQIQKYEFQIQLLELLSKEILPQLSLMDHNDTKFHSLFKVTSALCKMSKLKLPVLVTNETFECDI